MDENRNFFKTWFSIPTWVLIRITWVFPVPNNAKIALAFFDYV